MTGAVVAFWGSTGTADIVSVFIPNQGKPKSVQQYLTKVFKQYEDGKVKYTPADAASALVTLLRYIYGTRAEFAQYHRLKPFYLQKSEAYYKVKPDTTVEVFVLNDGLIVDSSWAGPLDDLHKAEHRGLDSAKDKLVRFFYNGGSGPGIRVVKVKEVLDKYIEGTDMMDDDVDNYKKYSLDKVEGEIKVLT